MTYHPILPKTTKSPILHSLPALEDANKVLAEFEGYLTDGAGEYVAESYYDRLTEAFGVAFHGKQLEEAYMALEALKELIESASERIRMQAQTHLRNHNKNI